MIMVEEGVGGGWMGGEGEGSIVFTGKLSFSLTFQNCVYITKAYFSLPLIFNDCILYIFTTLLFI